MKSSCCLFCSPAGYQTSTRLCFLGTPAGSISHYHQGLTPFTLPDTGVRREAHRRENYLGSSFVPSVVSAAPLEQLSQLPQMGPYRQSVKWCIFTYHVAISIRKRLLTGSRQLVRGMAAIGAMHAVWASITVPAFLRVCTSSEFVPWLLLPLSSGRLCSSCLVGWMSWVCLPPTSVGWLWCLKSETRMYLYSFKL